MNNKSNKVFVSPVVSYENADVQKIEILKANQVKTGIYR